MFKIPTVFIIGAGASAEFNMPTGPALQRRVEAILDPAREEGSDFWRIIGGQLGQDRKIELMQAAEHLRLIVTRFNSIDEALHFERANVTIVNLGKLCVAYVILRAERDSWLNQAMAGNENAITQCNSTWANRLLGLALSGTEREKIGGLFQNLTVVNFNYDRVLEQYLYWAMQKQYGVSGNLAAKALAPTRLKILRPYGSIGMLDWQGANSLLYGGDPDRLSEIAEHLRTYTEEQESANAHAIKMAISGGKIFVVIGFGYHKQNIDLLQSSLTDWSGRQGFMTMHGIFGENHSDITHAMGNVLCSNALRFYDMTGIQLLRNLQPTLSLAIG